MLRLQREKRIGRLQEQGKRNFEEKIFFVESLINPRTVESMKFFIEGIVCLKINIDSAINQKQHYIFSCATTLYYGVTGNQTHDQLAFRGCYVIVVLVKFH